MTFELKRLGRQKVRYDSANDDNLLRYQLVVDGAKVTPTSATISIYKPSSTTALISAVAMTVSGSFLTYQVQTTTEASWPVANGYRADIIVTYSTKTYDRTVLFDVVKYLLDLSIGFDQLVAFDDGVRGMLHDGQEDLYPLIEACRDVIQLRIEAKVLEDGQLIENMILDSSKVAVPALFYILHRLWFNKGDKDRSDKYERDYENMLRSVLSSIKYDKGQDGVEDATVGGLQPIRLVL